MIKTKKIRLFVIIILCVVAIITTVLVALSFNNICYYSNLSKPSRIVVYYDNKYDNIVFEPSDKEYNKIYSLLITGCEESILKSWLNGNLSKSIKVNSLQPTKVKFAGINIAFVYNAPQVIKIDNTDYWYKTLIFNAKDINKFTYNSVAIIPSSIDINYVDEFSYTTQLKVFSNFNSLYTYSNSLFKTNKN